VDALKKEITVFLDKEEYLVTTVFFGGGTPSILPAKWIADVMELLTESFRFAENAEISIECNPGTADREKLRAYRGAGINRISFGLQSAENEELKLLGRIHTWETFLETYDSAREVGFSNINVDLMSALPGQSVSSWEETLRKVLRLHPEHISAYSLIVEEGTPFYDRYQEDVRIRELGEQPKLLPSEHAEREMYHLTRTLLAAEGLQRYEISNYARPGYECRHNIGYWTGVAYAGFGLGASSLLINAQDIHTRYHNPEQMEQYLSGDFISREITRLTIKDQMEEFMFLGLRLVAGVSESEFARRFGTPITDVYGPVLERNQQDGLLRRADGRVALTDLGLDVSNRVMAEFLL
jgi:oxygen-independent coproporphyrinogen-3 oxidase